MEFKYIDIGYIDMFFFWTLDISTYIDWDLRIGIVFYDKVLFTIHIFNLNYVSPDQCFLFFCFSLAINLIFNFHQHRPELNFIKSVKFNYYMYCLVYWIVSNDFCLVFDFVSFQLFMWCSRKVSRKAIFGNIEIVDPCKSPINILQVALQILKYVNIWPSYLHFKYRTLEITKLRKLHSKFCEIFWSRLILVVNIRLLIRIVID